MPARHAPRGRRGHERRRIGVGQGAGEAFVGAFLHDRRVCTSYRRDRPHIVHNMSSLFYHLLSSSHTHVSPHFNSLESNAFRRLDFRSPHSLFLVYTRSYIQESVE